MREAEQLVQRLRRDLATAAEEADISHRFTPDQAACGHRRQRRPLTGRLLLAAAAVTVLGASVSTWALVGGDGDAPGETSCSLGLRWQGRTYTSFGELRRVPLGGADLGTGTVPGCNDGNGASGGYRVRVSAIPGVDPEVGVIGDDGNVYVPRGQERQTAQLTDLDESLPCTVPTGTAAVGTLVSVPANWSLKVDGAPYTAQFHTERPTNASGDGFPFGRYSAVTIPVRVTADTAGGTDGALLTRALNSDRPVSVTLACDGSRYVAQAIELAD